MTDERVLEEMWPGKAVTGILGEKTLKEILEYWSHVLRPAYWVFDDERHKLEDAVCIEGGLAGEEFIENAAQRPARMLYFSFVSMVLK